MAEGGDFNRLFLMQPAQKIGAGDDFRNSTCACNTTIAAEQRHEAQKKPPV